jgi:nicotinate-nucleotide pyrophosphorylase (carboxylating)
VSAEPGEREGGDEREIEDLVARAIAEDVGGGDVTSEAIVDPAVQARAVIVQKDPGIVYGFEVAELCFKAVDPSAKLQTLLPEAVWRDDVPAEVAQVESSALGLLAAERVALNFLGHLSGVASLTSRCLKRAGGTRVRLLDTRKTLPGLRTLEKRAVRAGGGFNHRMGLYDAILVKDNHVMLAGGVAAAVQKARQAQPDLPIQVECDSLSEVEAAVSAGAERIQLDNMTPGQVEEVVRLVGDRAELEASGGIGLDSLAAYAHTGVSFVSLGAVTHSAPVLDLSLMVVDWQ